MLRVKKFWIWKREMLVKNCLGTFLVSVVLSFCNVVTAMPIENFEIRHNSFEVFHKGIFYQKMTRHRLIGTHPPPTHPTHTQTCARTQLLLLEFDNRLKIFTSRGLYFFIRDFIWNWGCPISSQKASNLNLIVYFFARYLDIIADKFSSMSLELLYKMYFVTIQKSCSFEPA